MRRPCIAFRLLLALGLCVSFPSASQAAEAPPISQDNWLVYAWSQYEHPDAPTASPGKARRILSAWKRSDANIVDIVDSASQILSVRFLLESSALAFVDAIHKGKSFDVSDCAHAGRVLSFWDDPMFGYRANAYEAEFHCDLTDRISEVPASFINAQSMVLDPESLSVAIHVVYDTEFKPSKPEASFDGGIRRPFDWDGSAEPFGPKPYSPR